GQVSVQNVLLSDDPGNNLTTDPTTPADVSASVPEPSTGVLGAAMIGEFLCWKRVARRRISMTQSARLCMLALAAGLAARADFSYTQTTKSAGSTARATRQYVKGPKMKVESGGTATVFDLAARTITRIDNHQKTYSVRKLGGVPGAPKRAAGP